MPQARKSRAEHLADLAPLCHQMAMRILLVAVALAAPPAAPPPSAVPPPLAMVPQLPADKDVYAGDAPMAAADVADFATWLAGYRAAALARGVSPATVDAVLADLTPSPRVIALDRAQPGDSGTGPARFDLYLARRLDAARIAGGNAVADRLSARFADVAGRTGVPASIIIGIWGMETSYGRVTGDFDITRSLATLAWEGRRRQLFTTELDAVVSIIDRGMATRAMLRGSWAGAMGQPQFLPSSYLAFAVDGDGDGRADIWNSEADTIASIANYLARHGWQAGLPWGLAVTVPDGFDRDQVRNPETPLTCVKPMSRHSRWFSAGEWRRMGLTSDRSFPPDGTPMTLIEPDGPGQGAYLTTSNYRAIMAYNCSNFYALSVALLGDAVVPPPR